jgi:hypothetical protein
MSGTLNQLAHAIAVSPLHNHVVTWLRTVPGLPPIVQTVHILSIACVMGSIVMIDLRVLGIALPSQKLSEMIRRLMPWMWSSLVLLFLSGAVFVIARPGRYFVNPVFGIKLALLVPAVLLALVFHLLSSRTADYWEQSTTHRVSAKTIAGVSLLLWLGVVMAGRWIAYADYIFGE